MLKFLVEVAVPAYVLLLMLIAGTEVRIDDVLRLTQNFRPILLGSVGPLLLLPALVVLICAITSPPPAVSSGLLLLSLCPSGGISNYYCYLARSDVLLSAVITSAGTMLSLLSIPIFLHWLPALSSAYGVTTVPSGTIISQLIGFMAAPFAVGMLLRRLIPRWIEAHRKSIRLCSLIFLVLLLISAIKTVANQLSALLVNIIVSTTLFLLCAMLIGWILGFGMKPRDRAVLVVESSVRSVAVALLLGGLLLPKEQFGIVASFLTGYVIVEIAIMLIYCRHRAAKVGGGAPNSSGPTYSQRE
jgi:bile acid:Na+ symporter, BASS family